MNELERIQKEIEKVRIRNLKEYISQIELDDVLYELELSIFKAMDKASDGDLASVSHCDFRTIKVGEYIKCTKLYPQSKKYTVGKTYQIIKERNDNWYGAQVALRDDHNKLTWITRKHGISYTEFALVSCG